MTNPEHGRDKNQHPAIPHSIPRHAADKYLHYERFEDEYTGPSEHPLYSDRIALHRDTPIDGTVKTVVASNEFYSILVDTNENPEAYESLFSRVQDRIGEFSNNHNGRETDPERLILKSTFETVKKSMKTITREESLRYAKKTHEQADEDDSLLVPLSSFIEDGIGSSEHKAIATAATLQQFIDIGALNGYVSVDSAKRQEKGPETKIEQNSWVRFTDHNGSVTIIDTANDFCGSLRSSAWNAKIDYLRNEDIDNPRIEATVLEVINRQMTKETSGSEGLARKLGQGVASMLVKVDTQAQNAISSRLRKLVGTERNVDASGLYTFPNKQSKEKEDLFNQSRTG